MKEGNTLASNKPKSDNAIHVAELGVCLEHDDGIVRAQSWLKGAVTIACPAASPASSSPSTCACLPSNIKLSGELWVDLVGHEVSCIPAKGVLGGLWNKATRCSNVVQKEAIIFEQHNCVHDFTQSCPYNATDGATSDDKDTRVCPSYSFSIYLPGHLPPSMMVDETEGGGGGGSCGVQYQLRARLGETTTMQTLTVVGATLSSKKYPYILQPKIYPMHAGFPRRTGYLVLAARVENTHVGKGRDLHLSLSCRNRSVQWIDSVDVCLLETVQWDSTVSGTNQTNRDDTTGQQPPLRPNNKTFVLASFSNLLLNGLQTAIQDNNTDSPNSHDDPLLPTNVDTVTQAEMHNDLMHENSTVSIRLPARARDSYEGKLVTVSHCIQINLVVKNRAIREHPQVEIPIRVFDPPMETLHNAHPPIPSRKIESIATTIWVDRPPDAVMRSR